MLLLIDYDNVLDADRRQGVEHVVRKSFELCAPFSPAITRIRCRLYGGWYEGSRLTRDGQSLSGIIRSISPVRLAVDGRITPLLMDIELAASALSDPRTLVGNTLRKKGYPRTLRCESLPWLACVDAESCPILRIKEFVDDNLCTQGSCAVQPQDLLYKQEQKVVDTMMVADMILSSMDGVAHIAVVTRDDDIWPGLSIASAKATSLIHISTAAATRVPDYYNALRSPPYRRVHWS